MSNTILNRNEYERMYDVALENNEVLEDLYEQAIEVDYESPEEELEDLVETGLASYRVLSDENAVDFVAEITFFGEEFLENDYNRKEFVEEMLEKDENSLEEYS